MMRRAVGAVVLLWGCHASQVIEAVPVQGGAGGVGDGGVGGATTTSASSSTSGAGGMGGFVTSSSSSGWGGQEEWENDCANTEVTIQVEGEPPVVLTDPCSNWGAKYHDGPVAFEFSGGFLGELQIEACDLQNGRELYMSLYDPPPDLDPVFQGSYHSGSYPWTILSGELLQTGGPVAVGQVLEATIALTLTANTPATATLRVCHIPPLYLP